MAKSLRALGVATNSPRALLDTKTSPKPPGGVVNTNLEL